MQRRSKLVGLSKWIEALFSSMKSIRTHQRFGVRDEAMRLLSDYPRLDNVRQLAKVVEQIVVLTQNDLINRDDVPVDLIDWRNRDETSTMDFADFKEARAVFERRFLCRALSPHNCVIAQAAEIIGMSRKNLYIKLETLDID